MIAQISGKILLNNGAEVVVQTAGGVGYRLAVSPRASEQYKTGAEVDIETHLIVREDVLDLYGFANAPEKELFKHFISVSGVGPRTGLLLLGLGSVEEITLAIGRGDITYLTKVSGIGKKTAERLVLELKSKVSAIEGNGGLQGDAPGGSLGDIVDALVTLGYTAQIARDIAKNLDPTGKTSEQLLREALQKVR